MTFRAKDTAGHVSYPARLAQLAAEHPDRAAVIFVPREGGERVVTWREFDERSNRLARLLEDRGVTPDDVVVIALPNSPEHLFVTWAAWKLGVCSLPLSAAMPGAEQRHFLDAVAQFRRPVVVAAWDSADITPDELDASSYPCAHLPDAIAEPGLIAASGGSTGVPKIIFNDGPWIGRPVAPGELVPGAAGLLGMRAGQTQLMCGPLYHGAPVHWSNHGLFHDHTLVLMERFDAQTAVDLIERHRVNWMFLVPTMMRRIVQLEGVEKRDLSSVQGMWHAAAPCPPWVKRAWFDLIGPEKVVEAFGGSESAGATIVRGDEWLEHPGTVGRPVDEFTVHVLDEDQNELPPGEVGEIYFRHESGEVAFDYVGGAVVRRGPDGRVSLGDMGWLDDEGYLYIADRRVDLIITGGANIFPAEIEFVLTEHPKVGDVAVIGVPHEDLGKTAHAIVQPRDPSDPPTAEELAEHCRTKLAGYKVPRSFELIDELPRNEFGKIRRSALAAERS